MLFSRIPCGFDLSARVGSTWMGEEGVSHQGLFTLLTQLTPISRLLISSVSLILLCFFSSHLSPSNHGTRNPHPRRPHHRRRAE
jgi:hypothetical protein